MPQQAQDAVDELRELGNWDPDGPTDLHETISSLSGISDAVGGAYRQIARTLEPHGIHSAFSDILEESAGTHDAVSQQLRSKLDKGLMDAADGAKSPRVQGVINTIERLGAWTPDDPEDLHDTIQQLSAITDGVRGSYNHIADTVEKTGAHESYPPALTEAADNLGTVGDALETAFAGGVMRRPTG